MNNRIVLLGFKDEIINEKQKEQLHFTTNKFGGEAILPKDIELDESLVKCPLCQLWRPLVVQIYAPIDEASSSPMDRILYLYACINPPCWSKNECWLCIRVQSKNVVQHTRAIPESEKQTTDWCSGADDWGGDDNDGNDNNLQNEIVHFDDNSNNDVDDDDDESCSLEESLRLAVNNLLLDGDKNANVAIAPGAATYENHPNISAEIEGGNESECISIDSPLQPSTDLKFLMQQTAASLPISEMRNLRPHFIPFFINVYEETFNHSTNQAEGHIRELLQEYQRREDLNSIQMAGEERTMNGVVDEQYEESDPAHGDKLFHSFLSRIQANPGQILRYDRGGKPLLLRPQLHSDYAIPKSCGYCQSDMVFEFQILSTVIPSLQLLVDAKPMDSSLEFGTVLVYTCRNSCWDPASTTRIETVLLQAEVF